MSPSNADNHTGRKMQPGPLPSELRKDKDFYRDTGDTVFLVEQTLFKIHRSYITECEDSGFRTVFTSPQPESGSSTIADGSDDEHPIVLHHDTADQFRALCWVLYALPADLRKKSPAEEIPRHVALVLITNKWGFRSLEDWSMGVLDDCLFGGDPQYMSSCPEETLETVVSLCVQLDKGDLWRKIGLGWLHRLKLGSASMAHALDVGDRLALRSFLGRAYYVAMMQMVETPHSSPDTLFTPSLELPSDLSGTHVSRIHRGFCALSLLWNRIFLQQSSSSRGYHVAVSGVEHDLALIPSADVLSKLDVILDSNRKWAAFQFKDLSAIRAIRDEFVKTLPDYFLGPEAQP